MNQGNVTEFVSVGHRVSLQVNVEVKDDIPELVVGYMIKDRLGQPIFGTNTYHLNQTLTSLKKGEKRSFLFSFDARLGVGSYSVAVALHTSSTHLGKTMNGAIWPWYSTSLTRNNKSLSACPGLPPELEIS